MAYVPNFGCLDAERETLEEVADADCLDFCKAGIEPGSFQLAPVSDPAVFSTHLFDAIPPLPRPRELEHYGMTPPVGGRTTASPLAPKKGTTTLAFVYQGGIIVAVDSRASMGTFISSQSVHKVIEISPVILGTMAGGAADCSYWERYLSKLCRLYELRNQEKIPVAAASNALANIFYSWRGYGLCCGTMIAGWNEKEEEPELYYVDDKATRLKGKLFSCGSGSTFAYGVLDNSYRWDMTDEEAVDLGQRAIYHAAHRDGASGGLCRVYRCFRGGWEKRVAGADISELHYKYAEELGEDGSEL